MKKEDEIELFWYLIDSDVDAHTGYIFPGRQKIESLFDMPYKRLEYLLEKWFRQDIWNCGGNIFNGWFEKDAIEKFTKADKGIQMTEFKNRCNDISKVRAIYIGDVYDIYEELLGTKLDTDLAIRYHKERNNNINILRIINERKY